MSDQAGICLREGRSDVGVLGFWAYQEPDRVDWNAVGTRALGAGW